MIKRSHMGIYSITRGTYAEVVEQARRGLAPILRESDGFVSHSLTDLSDGRVVSLSTWDTREQAEAAGVKSAAWVGRSLADSIALRENVIGEMTILDSRSEPQSVTELLGELASRGTEAVRGLQRRRAASPDPPATTPPSDGAAAAESAVPEMASAERA